MHCDFFNQRKVLTSAEGTELCPPSTEEKQQAEYKRGGAKEEACFCSKTCRESRAQQRQSITLNKG